MTNINNQNIDTFNNKKNDFDIYNIKEGSIDSSKEYSIIVDFEKEEITGACFYYGLLNHMIDTKQCIELLEEVSQYKTPKRDFSNILDKVKQQLNNLK